MTGSATEARIAWNLLETGGRPFGGSYRVAEGTLRTREGLALYAVDSDGLRYVLFPVDRSVQFEEDRRSAGVQLQMRTLADSGRSMRYATLVCLKPRLADTFAALVDDVLSQVADAGVDPVSACRRVLDDWRDLLEREVSKGLSFQARVGLFGELWTLSELVRLSRDALRCWVGPTGSRHDFMAADISLETKTTSARRGRLLEIHGVEQLDAFPESQLYLGFVRIELVPAGGSSMVELIQDILERGVDRQLLRQRLNRLGLDEESNLDERFRVTEQACFIVDDAFPRIVSSSFVNTRTPIGVKNLVYQIELSGAIPVPLGAASVESVYRRLAGV